jgi:hypothetical protein
VMAKLPPRPYLKEFLQRAGAAGAAQ